MLTLNGIRKAYTGTAILDGVSVRFGPGEKTGIIGRNGAGKTTLLNILTGRDADFSGKVSRAAGVSVGFVPQVFPEFSGTVLEYVVASFSEMRREIGALESAMARSEGRELERVLERYGELRSGYDGMDGDGAEERALRYLEGAGLGGRGDQPVSVLSGGEKNVLALARVLLERPDVLVLDEPGNHLDIWGLAWLESFIRDYRGAVLVVSHNRYLLDRTVSRIVEIADARLNGFSGNYSAYRGECLRKAVAGEMAWKADRKKIERLEELVRRFEQIASAHPDPAWGRRLRARRTHLEKTREQASDRPAPTDQGFEIKLGAEASRARIALKVTGFSCGFGERSLLEDVSLLVETGERVALVGPNGCGKTTFLNAVMREGSPDGAAIRLGPSMKVSYCSQHGDGLDRSHTLFDECVRAGALNEDAAWKILSRFLFEREALGRSIGSLSGGELNRFQLALAVIAGANFLILDEPTNHLDIASCEAVEDALVDFAGTVLVVSHDRYFLDRIATRIVEIDGGDFVEYDGNFSEFWYRRYGASVRPRFRSGSAGGSGGSGMATLEGRGRSLEAAKGQAPGAAGVEARIVALEAERDALEREMAAERGKGNLGRARDLGNRLSELGRRIDRLYEEWA